MSSRLMRPIALLRMGYGKDRNPTQEDS